MRHADPVAAAREGDSMTIRSTPLTVSRMRSSCVVRSLSAMYLRKASKVPYD